MVSFSLLVLHGKLCGLILLENGENTRVRRVHLSSNLQDKHRDSNIAPHRSHNYNSTTGLDLFCIRRFSLDARQKITDSSVHFSFTCAFRALERSWPLCKSRQVHVKEKIARSCSAVPCWIVKRNCKKKMRAAAECKDTRAAIVVELVVVVVFVPYGARGRVQTDTMTGISPHLYNIVLMHCHYKRHRIYARGGGREKQPYNETKTIARMRKKITKNTPRDKPSRTRASPTSKMHTIK